MDLPRIAEPCHEPWEGMTPNAEGRHCASCALTVVDVASMPRAVAKAWLAQASAEVASGARRICVHAPRGRDGGIALPPPARARLLTNALAAMLAMAAAGCSDAPADADDQAALAEGTTERSVAGGLGPVEPDPGTVQGGVKTPDPLPEPPAFRGNLVPAPTQPPPTIEGLLKPAPVTQPPAGPRANT